MKAPNSFSRNRFFSSARFAIAVALMSAAAAMAFVAAKSSSPFLLGKSGNTDQAINKFRHDRDQSGGEQRDPPGAGTGRGPAAPAFEGGAKPARPPRGWPPKPKRAARKARARGKSLTPTAP